MKHLLIGVLSSAAALAFVCATPALANGGGDANAEADQAQFHASEPNQTPDWAPGQVAVGEVYRAVPWRGRLLRAERRQTARDRDRPNPFLSAHS